MNSGVLVAPALMKLVLALGCWLIFLFPSSAQGSPEALTALFHDANAHYQQGDFGSAERIYRQLADAGIDSGPVYYNLGNACFKQKKLGEAIYFWEKARQKLPGDEEIRENLELANLLVVDRIEVPADPLPVRILDDAVHLLTIRQESWIVLISFVATNLLLGIYFLGRNPRSTLAVLIGSIIAGSLFLVFLSSLAWKIYEQKYRQQGVVVEQKVDIRSGPGTENVTVFTVHEGVKVRVRGEAPGWYQVSLPNGWTGWLGKNTIRIL